MSTSGGRHAAATTAAAHYLERIGAALDVQVQPIDGADRFYRASATAPHPLADDVETTVRVSATSRDGALELARLELQSLANRCALVREAFAREVKATREAHLFSTRLPISTRRVRAAVVFRHGHEPTDADVDAAALAVRVREGRSAIFVGEVAREVLARQAFPLQSPDGQGTLVL